MESNKIEFDIIWTSTAYKTFDINIEFIKKDGMIKLYKDLFLKQNQKLKN